MNPNADHDFDEGRREVARRQLDQLLTALDGNSGNPFAREKEIAGLRDGIDQLRLTDGERSTFKVAAEHLRRAFEKGSLQDLQDARSGFLTVKGSMRTH
jgi:hypothetical protein